MNQLEKARQQIETIDKEMAQLYEQRLDAVKEVLAYKKEHQLPVLDASREEALIQKNVQYIKNPEYKEYYIDYLKQVMQNSKDYQQTLLSHHVIAYAGVKGSFSQMASEKLFPGDKKMSLSSFEEVFKAVVNQEAQYGVVPFENTNSGLVSEVLDYLLKYPVTIQRMADQTIEQCLLGIQGATLKDVEWVYSKDQALAQAKEFLQGLKVQTVAYPNTAMAAQYVASQKDKTKAAIGALENAQLYGLDVLAKNIQAHTENTTRFLVIGLEPQTQGNRFSIVFTTKHTSGALAKVIEMIAKYGLNMESIQSRPIQGKPFEYFFFIEMDGNLETSNTQACLEEIKGICDSLKVMGTYYVERNE